MLVPELETLPQRPFLCIASVTCRQIFLLPVVMRVSPLMLEKYAQEVHVLSKMFSFSHRADKGAVCAKTVFLNSSLNCFSLSLILSLSICHLILQHGEKLRHTQFAAGTCLTRRFPFFESLFE